MNKDSKLENDEFDEGPLWNRFWNKTFSSSKIDDNNELDDSNSQISGDLMAGTLSASLSHTPRPPFSPNKEIMNNASNISRKSENLSLFSPLSATEISLTFPFKLKDMSQKPGKVYRFTSEFNSISKLFAIISSKTKAVSNYPKSLDFISENNNSSRVCYVDDENDIVMIETDKDLEEAVMMSKRMGAQHLVVYLGEPILQPNRSNSSSRSQSPLVPAAFVTCEKNLLAQISSSPLAVNVAISAGIVLLTSYLISKMR